MSLVEELAVIDGSELASGDGTFNVLNVGTFPDDDSGDECLLTAAFGQPQTGEKSGTQPSALEYSGNDV